MSWLSVLVALAVGVAVPSPMKVAPRGYVLVHHHKKTRKHVKPKAVPRATPAPVVVATPAPSASPAPTVAPTPTPTATATPLPSRTGVDLNDRDDTGYTLVASHPTLEHGQIEFVGNNKGMDDHNLTVREGSTVLGSVALPAGESDSLFLTLAPGSYTLYCSLPGHEAAGMHDVITVQ